MTKIAKAADWKSPPAVSLRSLGDSTEKHIAANRGIAGLQLCQMPELMCRATRYFGNPPLLQAHWLAVMRRHSSDIHLSASIYP
jgi:hypothetical protein